MWAGCSPELSALSLPPLAVGDGHTTGDSDRRLAAAWKDTRLDSGGRASQL